MSKIQVRRGTQAELDLITPDAGEPCWTTDTNRLFIGDGSTQGGIPVALHPDEPGSPQNGDTWVNVSDEFCIYSDGKTWRLASGGWTDS